MRTKTKKERRTKGVLSYKELFNREGMTKRMPFNHPP
jgi:hypothetical protein